MDYERFLSNIALRRDESPIRKATNLITPPPYVLSAGLPSPDSFPIKKLTVELSDGSQFTINSEKMDLANGYSPTKGFPTFLKQLRELIRAYHNPPLLDASPCRGGTDILCTCGSQDALVKLAETLLNPGDSILIQDPCYATFLASLKPYKYNLVPVPDDKDGMKPEALRHVFRDWTSEHCRKTKSPEIPRVLYVMPHCSNPSGSCLTLERKKEIYKIAQDYDLLILEDDAYYFSHFQGDHIPSFLSLDVDGRVVRLDSFSKLMSAGSRVGVVTGPAPLLEILSWQVQLTIQNTSSLSQMVLSELLKHWGTEGFQKHVESIKQLYRSRCELSLRSAEKWLTGLATWTAPKGGMFLWLTIPGISDTQDLLNNWASKKGVSAVAGRHFSITNTPSPSLRLSYSLIPTDKIDTAFRLLSEAIIQEIAEQKKNRMQTEVSDNGRLTKC